MVVCEELEGNVIVFTGDGKGKTTAALGLACRYLGHAGRAAFIHFSGPARPSLGDVLSAKELGGRLRMVGIASQAADVSYLDQYDETVPTVAAAMARARQLLTEGECDLLVLDDINVLLHQGIIEVAMARELIEAKPASATILLTGRSAPEAVVEMADAATDFREVKHPVHTGVGPRKGLEF